WQRTRKNENTRGKRDTDGFDLKGKLALDAGVEVVRVLLELVVGEPSAHPQLVERSPVNVRIVQLFVGRIGHKLVRVPVDEGLINIAPGRLAPDREIRRDLPIHTDAVTAGSRAIGLVEQLVETGDLRRLQRPVG